MHAVHHLIPQRQRYHELSDVAGRGRVGLLMHEDVAAAGREQLAVLGPMAYPLHVAVRRSGVHRWQAAVAEVVDDG
jgi:hypothetical protein